MGRKKSVKTSNWTASNDLHIIRMSETGVVQMLKNKGSGVYYCILDNGKYQVIDNRTSKIDVREFNTAEEVIEYYNKKEGITYEE